MTQETQLINVTVNAWKSIIDRTNKAFASFRDDDLQLEVAPGRNRVYYLLGHLTAIHDRLLPLLRIGERLHPELDDEFLEHPDRTYPHSKTTPAALRKAWSEVNEKVAKGIEALRPKEWLERHGAVTEADFSKEPHRNRLAVFMSRVTHAAGHEGQIRLAR